VDPQVPTAIARGLAFLENAQAADGGWPGFRGSDPAITALVAKCFAQHPDYGPAHPVTRRAFAFIRAAAQPDGGIYLPDVGLRNYYTSVAVMALSFSTDPADRAVVAKAREFLVDLQWDEGEDRAPADTFYGGAGYGKHKRPDLSNTQMMLEALHDSGLSPEHPVYRKALVFISRCQMHSESNDQPFAKGGDGGFIYTCANGGESKAGTVERAGHTVLRSYGSMTYAGFKSMLYAGLKRDDPRVQAARAWIGAHYTLEQNPNMPPAQAQQGLYYYFHTFARALQAWDEQIIVDAAGKRHRWRADLGAKLLSLQRADGSWYNTADRWYESNPHLVTAYSVLALQATLPVSGRAVSPGS
jgi:squalene-hopene/tetraprenyl-beta-curcumene cyclase